MNKQTRIHLFFAIALYLVGCATGLNKTEGVDAPLNTTPQITESNEVIKPNETDTFVPTITTLPTPISILSAEVTPTVYPAQMPLLSTATPFPSFMWVTQNKSEYLVGWVVPLDWWDVSEQFSAPKPENLFWGAWANVPYVETLANTPTTVHPDGLMIFSMVIASSETALPQLRGEEKQIGWEDTVWFLEKTGLEAAPYVSKLSYSAIRGSFYYTFSFDCIPPDTVYEGDAVAFCRHVWEGIANNLEFCDGFAALPESPGWQVIEDINIGYAFEIPAQWPGPGGVELGAFSMFNHPIDNQPMFCPLPDHLMKVDVAALRPGNFAAEGQNPQDGRPNLEGFSEVPTVNYPAWLSSVQGGGEGGMFQAESKTLYIQAGGYWFQFGFICSPEWTADCDTILNHLIESFQLK